MIPSMILMLLSLFLFVGGVFLVLTRANAIMALMGIELMLNATNLSLAGFSPWEDRHREAQIAILAIMVIAAAEIAVALAIVLLLYRQKRTINLNE